MALYYELPKNHESKKMKTIKHQRFMRYGKRLFFEFAFFVLTFQLLNAQTYQVGNLITNSDGSQGIVFFVHPDGSSGWMVALTDASTGCAWGTNTDISTLTNINWTTSSGNYGYYYGALYDTAGYSNTQKIRAFQNNNTTYAAGKVDFANGWYLPSMGQLSELWGAQPFINAALTAAGGTILFSSDGYWSSSEYDTTKSWFLVTLLGYSGDYRTKTSTGERVRAVRSFSNQTIVYDTTLSYLWNTGSTQPYITPAPTMTTTYTVTATSGIGCTNSVTQTVFVNSVIPQTLYDTVCVGYPYQENGFNILASDNQITGTTLHTRTVTQNGCQATIQLYLYKKSNNTATLNVTICQGEQYYLNGVEYYNSGTYIQNLNSVTGCDSTLTLHITFYPAPNTVINQTACNSFTWNGNTYTQTGDYTQSFIGYNGCDSTVILHLTLHQTVYSTLKDTTCSNHPYSGFGFNIPATSLTTPGISYFKDTLTTQYGCDSIVTLLLIVIPNTTSTITQTVNENQLPITFNGQSFNGEVINYVITINNPNGCDSLINYTLHVNWNTYLTIDTTVCSYNLPITWRGYTFTQEGVVYDTTLNANNTQHFITYFLDVDTLTNSISNIIHVSCYGENTGGATAVPSGGTPNYTYSWSTQSTPSTIIATTNAISNMAVGSYRVTVTDQSGCTATSDVTILNQTTAMSPGDIASNQSICSGSSPVPLNGSSASGGLNSYYEWQKSIDNSNFSAANGINNTQNYTPSTLTQNTYFRRAWISVACGTVYSDTVLITILPVYRDTIQGEVCRGAQYQSQGFNLPSDSTQIIGEHYFTNHYTSFQNCDSVVELHLNVLPNYEEEFNATNCNLYIWNNTTYTETGDYTQLFQAQDGCDSTVTLHLIITSSDTTNITDTVCQGNSYNKNGFHITPPVTDIVQIIEQEITLTNVSGCDSIVALSLTVFDTSITIELLSSDFCETYTAELMVHTLFENYLWNTRETTLVITVDKPGNYSITAYNNYCEKTANYDIQPCELTLYLPNAFTPNGDGLNDYFSLTTSNAAQIVEFSIVIFNRWGQKIYESIDPYFKWDGKFNNEMVIKNEAYAYLIKCRINGMGAKMYTGKVIVLE